ncbi:MAG TPA: hypothetical protein VFK18_00625 [Luteimonas sp.]|nr:hypothetical protein [Luteimonas sp.]
MPKTTPLLAATLAACVALPMAAQARPANLGISDEIARELADARKEVRVELAKARQELETGNLQLDHSLRFGNRAHRDEADLPKGEITPAGDLLIDGEAQPVDAAQRQELLAYRQQVIGIAIAGMEVGQEAADAALDAVGGSWLGILFNAMTGRLENKVERVVQAKIQPMVLGICHELPALMASQQHLADSVPAFRPYANLQQRDIDDCERDVRQEFASR